MTPTFTESAQQAMACSPSYFRRWGAIKTCLYLTAGAAAVFLWADDRRHRRTK